MCGQENQPQKQNQLYVERGTVSLQNASGKLQNVHIQRVQRNQDVSITPVFVAREKLSPRYYKYHQSTSTEKK